VLPGLDGNAPVPHLSHSARQPGLLRTLAAAYGSEPQEGAGHRKLKRPIAVRARKKAIPAERFL